MITIPALMFYVFASVLMGGAIAVVTSKNPVHSVFFLILAFFNAAGLFVLLGAEYLAMTLVIVYVGAVAVLFLFVVMMLNIHFEKLRAGFIRALLPGVLIAAILFAEIGGLLYQSLLTPAPRAVASVTIPDQENITNARAIGQVLYTRYMILFELSGVILLVSMIGAIVLTLRHRHGVKRQKIAVQNARTRGEAVSVVTVATGKGVEM